MADLWERARRISGIDDHDALLKAALTAFVRREAAKGLVALGGTMPDFAIPSRERPVL
ncbi:type II toxin-antitoxin system VapB family antitoxin [Novosphingobium sp. Gsoil 351]|nr:type II toxin-antitoxin system VapB family antitoxin [Novosphingobium sp. Gsoil 351]